MTILPTGPQFGVKYTLTGPDGTVVTFNDFSDPNNVGTLTDISGFDSPEVRESADDLVEMDGGIHGSFFYGRRPITLSGLIHEHADAADRNMRMARLMQATNAMRDDAVLSWTPDGGVAEQFMTLRRQQPLRITGQWNKEFQISLVAADPRIYSADLHAASVAASASGVTGFQFPIVFPLSFGPAVVSGQMFLDNLGNAASFPVVTFSGPGTSPSLTNWTTGQTLALAYVLQSTDTITIDMLNRTVLLNGSTSQYSAIDFDNTDWWGLVPGTNDIRLSFFASSSPAGVTVQWRDAWL